MVGAFILHFSRGPCEDQTRHIPVEDGQLNPARFMEFREIADTATSGPTRVFLHRYRREGFRLDGCYEVWQYDYIGWTVGTVDVPKRGLSYHAL